MSIAEKLTTVAENQPKVYDAGFKVAIERYAPEFTESGASVTCNPVENYPLGVVSGITPIQSGSGDPTPSNVRPITAHTAVKVTVSNETDSKEYNAGLPADSYCGSFDWSTGVLTLTHKMLAVTGNEGWELLSNDAVWKTDGLMEDSKKGQSVYGFCSHLLSGADGTLVWDYIRKANTFGGLAFFGFANGLWGEDLREITVAKWKEYTKAQYDAGTPIQLVYELEKPLTEQLTAQEILALSGTNTVYSDTGDTTVTFKADPIALVAQLEESIISLGGDI